jgi:hypothetical protein
MDELASLRYGPDFIEIVCCIAMEFTMRPSVLSLIAVLVLAGGWASAANESRPATAVPEIADGSITISGGVVALGIGYEWARGTLVYQGRSHPFWVRGLSVMDIGAAKIAGRGDVFHLRSLADFEGNYAGTTFGSAISRGASLALITNENGVTIRARSTVSGIRFNFSGNGIRIRFTAPPKVSDQS